MTDRIGQQLGNYRLVKLLGTGGFAEVYLGQHVHLASKQAAIKILHLLDVDARKFQEEAETTEQLVHPHIVRLLDFALEQDMPFLVLDYAPGGSLRTRHPKGSIVPLATVEAYLNEVAPALQYAHDQRILHRDIKPDNMLIGRQGELLLSDFGIAVLTQTGRTSMSVAYHIGGTPFYMAPETYQGRPVKESDQYALAVVVYEWLCGSVPFSEGNFIQLGYQHSHEPVPPLREKNPAIPLHVESVIMKALAKEPKDRFASVQFFTQAFEQACTRARQAEEQERARQEAVAQQEREEQARQAREKWEKEREEQERQVEAERLRQARKAEQARLAKEEQERKVTIAGQPSPMPNQTLLPTELVTLKDQTTLPPTELALPSNPSTVPPAGGFPPSQSQGKSVAETSGPAATAKANLTPLGLGAFALTTFVISAFNTGLIQNSIGFASVLPLFYGAGGLAQLIVGIQAFRNAQTFLATAFCSYGAFWLALSMVLYRPTGIAAALVSTRTLAPAFAVFLLGWTIFTLLMFIGTLRISGALIAVFLLLFLTFLALTIGWMVSTESIGNTWIQIGGWLGIITSLVTAVLAWYTALRHIELEAAPATAKANPESLGLSAFALTVFVLSCSNAHFIIPTSGSGGSVVIGLAIFYGGIVQIIAGSQEFRTGKTFLATAFCTFGAFWLAIGLILLPPTGIVAALVRGGTLGTVIGVFFLAWTVFIGFVFFRSLRSSVALIVVFFVMFMTFLTLTIGWLSGLGSSTFTAWIQISGWLGILLALTLWYTALALLLSRGGSPFKLPVGSRT